MTELATGANTAQEMVQTKQPFVHDIIDMRQMSKFPLNLREIVRATGLFGEPNLGWVILISDNRVVRFLTEAVMQTYKTRFRAFGLESEAIAFLKQMDESLQALSVLPPIDEAFKVEA